MVATREELRRHMRGIQPYQTCLCADRKHKRHTGNCDHGVSTAPCMDCPRCDAETQDAPFSEAQAFDDRKVDP